MKNQVKICLKTAWLVAAIAILLMGTTLCVSTGESCVQAGNTMFSLMLLMTLPTGIFFFLVAAIFVGPGSIHQSSDFITAWFIMMCGGLLQWFLIVPSLFEKPGLTTLNLETATTLPSLGSQDRTLPLREVSQPAALAKTNLLESPASLRSTAVQLVRNRTTTRRKSIRSIAAFDRAGRTPLERVIDHS
jgi:hypothetical protein